MATEQTAGTVVWLLRVKPDAKETKSIFDHVKGAVKGLVPFGKKNAKDTGKVLGALALAQGFLNKGSAFSQVMGAFLSVLGMVADLFVVALMPVWRPLLMNFVEWAKKFGDLVVSGDWKQALSFLVTSIIEGLKTAGTWLYDTLTGQKAQEVYAKIGGWLWDGFKAAVNKTVTNVGAGRRDEKDGWLYNLGDFAVDQSLYSHSRVINWTSGQLGGPTTDRYLTYDKGNIGWN